MVIFINRPPLSAEVIKIEGGLFNAHYLSKLQNAGTSRGDFLRQLRL
jgi:hypothetical protein